MVDAPYTTAEDDKKHHTYTTHRIPWYVRAMWVGFWIGMIWYIVAFAIPSAKDYYKPVEKSGDASVVFESNA
jgi:hypothetical protein